MRISPLKKIFLCLICFCLALLANELHFEQIKFALAQEFKFKFQGLIINDIQLSNANLPKNFDKYYFLKLAQGRFDRASGYVRAEFKTPENIKKNVFFRYFIKAKLEVLRSNKELQRGDVLTGADYTLSLVDFDKVPPAIIYKDDDLNLLARTNIKKNSILRRNMFKANYLVKKDAILRGILEENEIKMIIELVALESGNEGDLIKVRNKDGKIMQALIINRNQVNLQ